MMRCEANLVIAIAAASKTIAVIPAAVVAIAVKPTTNAMTWLYRVIATCSPGQQHKKQPRNIGQHHRRHCEDSEQFFQKIQGVHVEFL